MPVSRPKWLKTIPFGAAHTYIAYIGEYPPRDQQARLLKQKTNALVF